MVQLEMPEIEKTPANCLRAAQAGRCCIATAAFTAPNRLKPPREPAQPFNAALSGPHRATQAQVGPRAPTLARAIEGRRVAQQRAFRAGRDKVPE